jgi:hypothetical protein
MPFVYSVDAGTLYTAAATNTEDPTIVIRQTTRGMDLTGMYAAGRANAATTISGLNIRVRRWTTAGTGGTTVTPAPRRIGTTASTVCVDKASAITAGTVSGAYQVSFGFGKAGPGGWVARDADSAIHLEAGSADELDLNSIGTEASLTFILSAEIVE